MRPVLELWGIMVWEKEQEIERMKQENQCVCSGFQWVSSCLGAALVRLWLSPMRLTEPEQRHRDAEMENKKAQKGTRWESGKSEHLVRRTKKGSVLLHRAVTQKVQCPHSRERVGHLYLFAFVVYWVGCCCCCCCSAKALPVLDWLARDMM